MNHKASDPLPPNPNGDPNPAPPSAQPGQSVALSEPAPVKQPMQSGGKIAAIVPRDHVECFRFADAFVSSGMVPPSYGVFKNAQGKECKEWDSGATLDREATRARCAIGIMKGMEIGLPPVTALSTICVINNRPCLWGDGAVALVQQSGKVEWMKDWSEGAWNNGSFVHHFQIKRRDEAEPVTRSFSFDNAKAAALIGKKGPWMGHPERMCFNRARAWALRDAFSDVLMGIGIAEEVRDTPSDNLIEVKPDVSVLDDAPAIEDKTKDDQAALEETPQPEPVVDPEADWRAKLDELKEGMERCKNMAEFQLFWVDNTKSIDTIKGAPASIQAAWNDMVGVHKVKMNKKPAGRA